MLGATDALAMGIAANGLREPTALLDGKILDGGARYRARAHCDRS